MRKIVASVAFLLLSRGADGQRGPDVRVFDLVGFTAVGVAPRAVVDLPGFNAIGVAPRAVVDLPGFNATGVAARVVVDHPGFTATGIASRTLDVPGFTAAGSATDSSPQSKAESLRLRRGRALPPPTVIDSAPPVVRGCAGGCFNATGTEDDRSFSLRGPAVVNVDDGSRFQIVLGKLDNEASYVSFARDPGGPPRAGTYAITDQCSEEPKAIGAASFAAEFVTRAYEADATSYLSAGGSLVIERAAQGRIAGRFNFTACRFDPEGKRHEVHVRGTFDGVR